MALTGVCLPYLLVSGPFHTRWIGSSIADLGCNPARLHPRFSLSHTHTHLFVALRPLPPSPPSLPTPPFLFPFLSHTHTHTHTAQIVDPETCADGKECGTKAQTNAGRHAGVRPSLITAPRCILSRYILLSRCILNPARSRCILNPQPC